MWKQSVWKGCTGVDGLDERECLREPRDARCIHRVVDEDAAALRGRDAAVIAAARARTAYSYRINAKSNARHRIGRKQTKRTATSSLARGRGAHVVAQNRGVLLDAPHVCLHGLQAPTCVVLGLAAVHHLCKYPKSRPQEGTGRVCITLKPTFAQRSRKASCCVRLAWPGNPCRQRRLMHMVHVCKIPQIYLQMADRSALNVRRASRR